MDLRNVLAGVRHIKPIKLRESIMSEQTESKGIEKLTKKVDNPDDDAELIKKIDKMIKSKKNNVLMIAYQQGKNLKLLINL